MLLARRSTLTHTYPVKLPCAALRRLSTCEIASAVTAANAAAAAGCDAVQRVDETPMMSHKQLTTNVLLRLQRLWLRQSATVNEFVITVPDPDLSNPSNYSLVAAAEADVSWSAAVAADAATGSTPGKVG